MTIALIHRNHDAAHLARVTEEMFRLGPPEIRAVWSTVHGVWLAVEGCHRLRAADELGLTPRIVDVSHETSIDIEIDGQTERVDVADLAIELTDAAPNAVMIQFEDPIC